MTRADWYERLVGAQSTQVPSSYSKVTPTPKHGVNTT